MKKIFFLSIFILQLTLAFTQGIGVGTSSPDASAQLDISSDTKGLLLPRMTTAKISTVNNPAKGLLVYDSTLNQLMINSGTKQSPNWNQIASSGWSLSGNNGTNPSVHFIGTTDNKPLLFRVNNVPSGRLDSFMRATYIGFRAGGPAENLFGNVAIGYKASASNTAGSFNTIVGTEALTSNISGSHNSALGALALYSNTHGSLNMAIGYRALYANTTGSNNIAVGFASLESTTTGYNNTAIGAATGAYNTTGSHNTAIGYYSQYSNTTGTYNTSAGANALYGNTTGYYNTAVGFSALHANTTGYYNNAVGVYALASNTTGAYNIAVGNSSLYANTSGNYNTASGIASLPKNSTGSHNTATGYSILADNTNGAYNVAMGNYALERNAGGSGNTAIGYQALDLSVNASNNTALGFKAGRGFGHGWNNTLIGAETNVQGSGYYNSIALGSASTATASNQARIGNSSTYSIGGFANWSNISDGRYKTNIREDVSGLAFIMKLRPVTYQLDITSLSKKLRENMSPGSDSVMKIAVQEKESMIQSGFIAQEVEKSATELGYNFSGVDKPKNENDLYGLRYAEFVVPLVKAVQEQQQLIEELRKEVAELKKVRK